MLWKWQEWSIRQERAGNQEMAKQHRIPRPTDMQLLTGVPVVQVACGDMFSLALTATGSIYAFGRNDAGQLGLGDTTDRLKPVRVHRRKCLT